MVPRCCWQLQLVDPPVSFDHQESRGFSTEVASFFVAKMGRATDFQDMINNENWSEQPREISFCYRDTDDGMNDHFWKLIVKGFGNMTM